MQCTRDKTSLKKMTVHNHLRLNWRAGEIVRKKWHDIVFRFRRAYKDPDTKIVSVYGRDGLVLRYKLANGRAIIL